MNSRKRSPCLRQPEQLHLQQWRPSETKNKLINLKKKKHDFPFKKMGGGGH